MEQLLHELPLAGRLAARHRHPRHERRRVANLGEQLVDVDEVARAHLASGDRVRVVAGDAVEAASLEEHDEAVARSVDARRRDGVSEQAEGRAHGSALAARDERRRACWRPSRHRARCSSAGRPRRCAARSLLRTRYPVIRMNPFVSMLNVTSRMPERERPLGDVDGGLRVAGDRLVEVDDVAHARREQDVVGSDRPQVPVQLRLLPTGTREPAVMPMSVSMPAWLWRMARPPIPRSTASSRAATSSETALTIEYDQLVGDRVVTVSGRRRRRPRAAARRTRPVRTDPNIAVNRSSDSSPSLTSHE